MNKKQLYESIISSVAKQVKRVLNENYKYKIMKANDLENLYEKTLRKYKIDEEEFEDLMYIIDSDNHIFPWDLYYLIKKLQIKKGKIPSMHLYRGCSNKEFDEIIKNGKSPVNTLSFSENKDIASHFGEKIIEIIAEVPLFCYHEFLGEYYTNMKNIDPEAFEMNDGEFIIELAEEEAEWICTNDYMFVGPDKNGIYKLINN